MSLIRSVFLLFVTVYLFFPGQAQAADCGAAGQKACAVWKSGPQCRDYTEKIDGYCRRRGGNGEKPYSGLGFKCRANYAVGDSGKCTRCGGDDQPTCEVLRSGPRCKSDLKISSGYCYGECGGVAQRSCPARKRGPRCEEGLERSGAFCSARSAFIEPIEIYGKCLQSNGAGKIITLESCDPKKLAQYWFHAGRRSVNSEGDAYIDAVEEQEDGKILTSYAITSVDDPTLCITASGSVNSGRTVMQACVAGQDNQRWIDRRKQGWVRNRGEKRQIQSPTYGCLNVRASNKSAGTDILVWNCSAGTKNMEFAEGGTRFGNSANFMVRNKEIVRFYELMEEASLMNSTHSFSEFHRCSEQNGETCALSMESLIANTNWQTRQYGRFMGKGHGYDPGEDPSGMKPLDMGARYSADRCSQAHDNRFWDNDSGDYSNDAQMVACLDRSVPMTRDEQYALFISRIGMAGLTAKAALDGFRNEPDCAHESGAGWLPPVGTGIGRCDG